MLDDVYELAIRQQLNGRPVVNVLAFRRKVSAEPTTTDFLNLVNNVIGNIKAYQVDDLSYQDWRATQVRGAGATYSTSPPFVTSTVSYTGAITPASAGALTGTPLPNNNAIVVSVNTAQAGRRRRGRFFIGGIAEVWVDDNSLVNATQLATLQGSLNTIITNWGASGSDTNWELGVWSRRIATNAKYVNTTIGPVLTSQGAPDPSTAFMAATSLTARNFVGSQRDRRPGL